MKKIKYSRLFILGVFIYLIFKGISLIIGLNTSVLVLKDDFYTMKTKEKGIVIRDEHLIKSDTNGTLSLLVNRNEKVQKSQNIATVYNNNIDEGINEELKKLKDEIKDLESENNSLKAGILSVKTEQMNILEEKIKSNSTNYSASESGVISYKYDNNENKYGSNSLSNITKEDIDNASNNYIPTSAEGEKVKQGSIIARVVNNNDCYMAFVREDNKLFNEGDSVKIEIKDNEINGEIYKICKKDNYSIVIVKFTQQNIGIYDTRVEEFDIIYKQMEALRIPKKSLVKKDNKKGVYVINEENNKPEFIEVKGISFEDDIYIYVDFRSNEANGINTVKLHDRIILKPNFINKGIAKIN